MKQMFSSTDKALAQRIEAGHALSGRNSARLPSEQNPNSIAAVEAMAGGWAVFQGVDLPFTQALAVGMDGPVSPEELDRLEAFFHDRDSPAVIDLCTLAHPSVFSMVQERGYVLREVTNVLVRRLDRDERFCDPPPGIEFSEVKEPERKDWMRLILRGFLDTEEVPEDQVDMLSSTHQGLYQCFALYAGQRLGGAAMEAQNGLVTLFGDATLVAGRGRGLQLAGIHHRLHQAAQLGCDLASASVLPGSISHRNYERAGFQFVYARVMVSRKK